MRIGSLSAALLGAVVLSTLVITLELTRNQIRVKSANQGFHRLQVAAEADRNFREMRFWLTYLSVSLLTLAERRADAAREKLDGKLQELAAFAPDAAESIGKDAAGYYADAMKAADAYTLGNRIIGNTLLAKARQGSDAVDETLTALIGDLAERADRTSTEATQASERALLRAMIACAVIVAAGTILTWRVLRSILVPMRANSRAISALISGDRDVVLPPEGPDELGRMSQALRALRDSQDKRRALEEQTRDQRNTILTAIETIPDGFALFDSNERLVMANERYREMFPQVRDILVPGVPFEDILRALARRGRAATAGMPEADWIAERLLKHEMNDGLREEIEIEGAWVQVSKRKTPDGGTVTVYSDITDLKSKQEQLEEAREQAVAASSAKSQFLASMSHELRTPLNAIIGYSEMLAEDAQEMGFDDATQDLEKIMASGRHLLSLINDVLDLSKIEAGKMELYVETFELRPLLDEVAATVAPLIEKNGNKLVLNVDIGDAVIETDKTKLRQNLFNLLSNAAKFTRGGRIELNVERFARDGIGMFRFAVRDDGIGISDTQRQKLFSAFVQADQSTTRNFGGTGLGLAIAQQFTRMMGGQITVESEEGVGSVFTFEIPCRAATGISTETTTDTAPREGRSGRGLVLIIDDEEDARVAAADIVRAGGYDVLTVGGAERGLELARAHRPDAIILDVIMPERDGWSALREIRSDPDLSTIPVILVTIVSDREMGLVFGAVELLTKPVDPALLVATLNGVGGPSDREALIVDDDVATRTLFRRILSREGWRVREAADGQDALRQLEIRRPTLMLLDILMPNVNGFDVLTEVRGRDELADLPVIVVTSKDLTREETDWLKAHAGDVIHKGEAGRTDLVAALKRHLKEFE